MTIKARIELDPRIKLKAKRSLDGNIMIFDHEDIDIVYIPESNKCITFPKDEMNDKVYSAQDRMFTFLSKKGVIKKSSVQGGNIFGSMEAEVLQSKYEGIDRDQVFLFVIHEYITGEKPYFKTSDEFEEDRLDHMLRPSDEDSTELGDVPQSDTKGAMDPRVQPFGLQYNYSIIRENESED